MALPPNPKVTLKISGKGLNVPLSGSVTGLASIMQSSLNNMNTGFAGLRINPGALMKTEPFNNLARQVEVLTTVVQVLAKRTGMTQAEVDKLMADAMTGVRVAEELLEK